MIRGRIEACAEGILTGWVLDSMRRGESSIKLAIELDGQLIGATDVSIFRPDLQHTNVQNGRHGFAFLIPTSYLDEEEHQIAIRVSGDSDASAIDSRTMKLTALARDITGKVDEFENGVITGWVADKSDLSSRLIVEFVNGPVLLGKTEAKLKRKDLHDVGLGDAKYGFSWPLMPEHADSEQDTVVLVRTTASFGHCELGAVSVPPEWNAGLDSLKPGDSVGNITDTRRTDDVQASVFSAPSLRKATLKAALARASEYETAGSLKDALGILSDLISLHPSNFDILFRIARVMLASKRHDEAISYAQQALHLRPAHPKPSITLARAFEARGDRLIALRYWQNVPENDSSYLERLLRSARMLVALERTREAEQCLQEAVGLRPEDHRIHRSLAQLYEDLQNIPSAQLHWAKVCEYSPEDQTARRRLEVLASVNRVKPWSSTPAFYRDAMRFVNNPIQVLSGSSPTDIALAIDLGRQISHLFGMDVNILTNTSEFDSANNAVVLDLSNSRKLRVFGGCSGRSELAFVLPEYQAETLGRTRPIEANLKHFFLDFKAYAGRSFAERSLSYLEWIEQCVGLSSLADSSTITHANKSRVYLESEAEKFFKSSRKVSRLFQWGRSPDNHQMASTLRLAKEFEIDLVTCTNGHALLAQSCGLTWFRTAA